VLLAEVVATSRQVASTPARSAKIAALARLLGTLAPEEMEPAVAFLAGEPRQGKVGVGWATIVPLDVPPATEAVLTVADLDQVIADLAGLAGPGSSLARQQRVTDLFGQATADEAEFIRRLILGELRQGALEGIMTEAVARAAQVRTGTVRRALMLAGDLPKVASLALQEGEAGLLAVRLELFRPILPMLAATAGNVEEAIEANGLSSVEWKIDGARVQAHRRGGEVRLFTRNLNDVTARLPGVAARVASLPADRFILDGEVAGLGDDEGPDRFQDTMSRFSRHDGLGAGLRVWWFDCLHAGGTDLIDRPLLERSRALDEIAGPWRAPFTITDDGAVATWFLDGALAAGHEGVMVKAVSSRYEAGRRGQAWRKVKPVRTLDLVVLAAEWGHGRRRGWLSNLHLGARDTNGGWVMVGKTFKGLTDELLAWQTARFLDLEVARHQAVVEVRPELVVEIALDGVQASSRYRGGVALRFARVRRYRPDKSPADADDIDAVRALLPATRA
jgi:DNA ligase-1